MTRTFIILCLCSLATTVSQAQVNWMSFEELDSALNAKPKPVFLEFTTEWCTYCKKMDQEVFTHAEVINELNSQYYAVRMDAEVSTTIVFDGSTYQKAENDDYHQLAMLLANQNGQFTPPALIFLSKEFEVEERVFSYQSRKNLMRKLRKHQ